MKDVGGRRVVHDEDPVELPAQAAQVLDVVAAVEDAGLAEQARVEHVPLVEQVGHRVGVLAEGEEERRNNKRDLLSIDLLLLLLVCPNCLTFAKLAVNRTHSKSSPILHRNSSTCGRFSTYTWCIVPSISTGTMKSALFIGWKKKGDKKKYGLGTNRDYVRILGVGGVEEMPSP